LVVIYWFLFVNKGESGLSETYRLRVEFDGRRGGLVGVANRQERAVASESPGSPALPFLKVAGGDVVKDAAPEEAIRIEVFAGIFVARFTEEERLRPFGGYGAH
jgi:hypothetical protein